MRFDSLTRNKPMLRSAESLQLDFKMILLSAVVLLALMVAGEWAQFLFPVRVILGLAFVLFVPGYCMVEALFPNSEELDGISKVGLSLGLSVATIPLLVLLLNILPWGIHPWPILVGVYSEIAVWMWAAQLRRSKQIPDNTYGLMPRWSLRSWWRARSIKDRPVVALLSAALLLAGFWAAWMVLSPPADAFTTEFYILGTTDKAESYPNEVVVGSPQHVTMGIANQEKSAQDYRVEVWVSDPWNSNAPELVSQPVTITLQPGQKLEQAITWTMPHTGEDQQVEFLLFRGDSPQVYRSLRLILNVVAS